MVALPRACTIGHRADSDPESATPAVRLSSTHEPAAAPRARPAAHRGSQPHPTPATAPGFCEMAIPHRLTQEENAAASTVQFALRRASRHGGDLYGLLRGRLQQAPGAGKAVSAQARRRRPNLPSQFEYHRLFDAFAAAQVLLYTT